jgi:multimeric flavodoxin WrbA
MKILGFTGSHRAVYDDAGLAEVLNGSESCDSDESLRAGLEELVRRQAPGQPSKTGKRPSNSEIGLFAAAWSARRKGVDFEAVSLKHLFSAGGDPAAALKTRLAEADAVMVSTPVYFGDRSSLVQRLVDLIGNSPELRGLVQNKIFGGVAAGAKRNGGQETTLIYLILDMLGLGFLAVGNDSSTTSQYGGTLHAGDSGSAAADAYGLNTAMGVGARLGALVNVLGQKQRVADRRILFLLLQDSGDVAADYVRGLLDRTGLEATVTDCTGLTIRNCQACSFCPNAYSPDDKYACIINGNDGMKALHGNLLDNDVIVPVVYCPADRSELRTVYQSFMERTRYIRRSDYSLSNTLIAPLVLTDLGVSESYHMRMITSLIRHHTIMHRPMVGYYSDGLLLNEAQMERDFESVVAQAARVGAGRLLAGSKESPEIMYNPVGYVLKNPDGNRMNQRGEVIRLRRDRMKLAADKRLGG